MILFDLLVNKAKCRRDGLCAADCPLGIISLHDEGYPAFAPGKDSFCISCGHCVAICPHAALGIPAMPADACPPIAKELRITARQAAQFLKSRRSMRQYKPDQAPRPTLARLIELAGYGPSGHNRQPIDWLVINGQKSVAQAAGLVADWMVNLLQGSPEPDQVLNYPRVLQAWEQGEDRILRGAPHLFVAHAPEQERTAPAAAGQVVAYMELAASALGLGSCWAGYFTSAAQEHPPLRKWLALPVDHMVFAGVMVGYPGARYFRIPLRREPRVDWR